MRCLVVHVGGRAVKSCTMFAVQVDGENVLTIETAKNGKLHPMQAAFPEHHGLQSGFCTPG
jgi:carbon-monoxide dehydrogenase small subunit